MARKAIVGIGLLALLFWGRKTMARKPTEMGLTPHFRLSEFLRSRAVPEVAFYKPTTAEINNAIAWAEKIGEPLRAFIGGPVVISGGARPDSVRNARGENFYEALKARGYAPAENSDHEDFTGFDVQFPGKSKDAYLKAYEWLRDNPNVRQVGIYFRTNPDNGQVYADHIHISVITPIKPRRIDAFSYARLDNQKIPEDFA